MLVGLGGRDAAPRGKIDFLADGSAVFAKALGLDLDLTERGMGVRSKRYSMLVKDGVVKELNIEPQPGVADLSGAEHISRADQIARIRRPHPEAPLGGLEG